MTNDKTLHFVYMYAVQLTLLLFFGVWSLFASLIFPLAKEFIWDKWMKRGYFEWLDFIASLIGGVVAYLIWII